MHYKFTSITISNVAFGMSYRWFLHNSIEQHNYAKQQSNAVHRDGSMGAVSHQCSLLVLHGSAAARTHWPRDLRGSTGAASTALVPRPPWLSGGADSLAPRLDGCSLGSARSSSSMARRQHGLTGSAASAARRVRPPWLDGCGLSSAHSSSSMARRRRS